MTTLEAAYSTLSFNAHPDTINHLVIFSDGSTEWQTISPREKAFYVRTLDNWLSDYANSLKDQATDH